MRQNILKWSQKQLRYPRDPRYVFIMLASFITFLVCLVQVKNEGLFDSVEKPVFEYFNSLPGSLYDVMLAVTQMGGLGSLLVWMPLAWYLINKRAAGLLGTTGIFAWFGAKVFKTIAQRGRPGDILSEINLFNGEKLGGYGFPSGHATFVAACVIFLFYQISPKIRKYLLLAAFLVGVSRMYLGAHFPLDIVGGWALGALIGATFCIVFGVSSKGISAPKLKKFLNSKGLKIKSLVFADVDARGSRPLFITTEDNKKYFGKLFGKREHAADWLFKIFRFFRYKNLHGEEPHFSSRRNVEIEAFLMLWARQAGVRVAKLIDIFNFGTYWVSIQERIDGKPLSVQRHLSAKSLKDTWKQVQKMHNANIAHRDLRASNVLIDKKGDAWVIDFGFAEASASSKRKIMDNAELLMSMSLVVGVERTLRAAKSVLSKQDLKATLPFLQTAVFSRATTKQLKQNKSLLNDLKTAIVTDLKIKEEIDNVNILRLNKRKIINLILMTFFIYFIAPQLGEFRDALFEARITNFAWLLPLALVSLSTYVITGLIYVALASVPLRLRDATLVQLASSFVSKVMPGGLAGTTLNAKYMTKAGLSPVETSAVISSQAIIGFIMFMLPLGLFLLLHGTNIFDLIDISISKYIVFAVLGVIALSGTFLAFQAKTRSWVKKKITDVFNGIKDINIPSKEYTIAAAASLMVTVAYITCLYLSLQSVGLSIGVTAVILAYATATIAKSALPTPGGLGPVEAALIATLITFGASKVPVISAVLIYRLATFWIPIPFSLLAYQYINKRELI